MHTSSQKVLGLSLPYASPQKFLDTSPHKVLGLSAPYASPLESLPDNIWHLIFWSLHDDPAHRGNALSRLAQCSTATAKAVRRCRANIKYKLVDSQCAQDAGHAFMQVKVCHHLHLHFECRPPATCGSLAEAFLRSASQQQCQHVQELVVSGNGYLDDQFTAAVCPMLPSVRSFTMQHFSTTFAEFSNLALASFHHSWPGLHTLRCYVPSLNALHVSAIAGLTSLTNLSLRADHNSMLNPLAVLSVRSASTDTLAALTALTKLELDLGRVTSPPASWDFLVGMTRLQELHLFQEVCPLQLSALKLELSMQLANAVAALPALQVLGVPSDSLVNSDSMQPAEALQRGASWSLPTVHTLHITAGTDLDSVAACLLADRCPKAKTLGVNHANFVLNACDYSTPQQLQLMLRALKVLDERGWLGMEGAMLSIKGCFQVSVEELERAWLAVAAPSGSNNDDGSRSKGDASSPMAVLGAVRHLRVFCKPEHMVWVAENAPCLRVLECGHELLRALPDLSDLPFLDRLMLLNPMVGWGFLVDPEGVCGALGSLRVPEGRVVEVKSNGMLSQEHVKLAAACLAPHGLRVH